MKDIIIQLPSTDPQHLEQWNSLKLFQDGNSLEKKLWCCVGGILKNENNLSLSTEALTNYLNFLTVESLKYMS